MNDKMRAIRLSVASNTVLTIGKLAAGLSMNSVSIISEAVHSGLDLIAALIAYVSVRESSKPADERHHYGHGKFENVASITEAILILGAAGVIIGHAYPKLYGRTEIYSLDLGVAVMGISALVNFFISRNLFRVSRKTESPALEADGWHLLTDVYTSLGVLAGIVAIKFTGLTIIDPLIAIGVSLLIVKAAVKLIRESMHSILDARLPETEEQAIKAVLAEYAAEFVEFHQLRTRKAGSQRYVDLHLVVPAYMAVEQAHMICHKIEDEISCRLAGMHVLIHAEPCDTNCRACRRMASKRLKDTGCRLSPPGGRN